MGLAELVASPGNKPMDYNEIGKILQGSLKEMMQARQMRDLAEVVKTLATSDAAANRQEPTNPFSVLKDVGFDLPKMIEVNHKVAESALEQAEKERQRRMEEEKEVLALKQQQFNEQLMLMEKLLQLQQTHSDKVMELQRQMYESRLQQGQKPSDALSDQLNQFMLTLLTQTLKERLNPPQPANPLEQIQSAIQLTSHLQKVFGGNSNNDDSRLRWELEKMKLEREDARWRAEMEARREAEERKARQWEALVQQLSAIIPAIVQSVRGNGATTGTATSSVSTAASVAISPPATSLEGAEIICPNCGEDFHTTETEAPTCPHCHTQLVKEANQ